MMLEAPEDELADRIARHVRPIEAAATKLMVPTA